jgi:hypothetical protein
LGVECKLGGNYHPTLNIAKRPIANKYREGKLKSTPKGESKYLKSLRWKRVPYFVRQELTFMATWKNFSLIISCDVSKSFYDLAHDPS